MQFIVAGSGKAARDAGLFLLARGHRVAFVSRDPARLEALSRRVEKDARRDRAHGENAASFHLYEDDDIPAAPFVFECVVESVRAKQIVLAALAPHLEPGGAFLSASASIAPQQLSKRCVGAHFFFPIELTRLVELIVPQAADPQRAARVRELLDSLGLARIEQDERNAFAVSRLTTPLRNECFKALRAGADSLAVDRASESGYLPGQLSEIDALGIDAVHAASLQYLERMPEPAAAEFAPLREGLAELLSMGKLGRKNGDGLMSGLPLPWPAPRGDAALPARFAGRLAALFRNTCATFVERGEIREDELALALGRLYGAEYPWKAAGEIDVDRVRHVLDAARAEDGASYWEPSARLA